MAGRRVRVNLVGTKNRASQRSILLRYSKGKCDSGIHVCPSACPRMSRLRGSSSHPARCQTALYARECSEEVRLLASSGIAGSWRRRRPRSCIPVAAENCLTSKRLVLLGWVTVGTGMLAGGRQHAQWRSRLGGDMACERSTASREATKQRVLCKSASGLTSSAG